MPRFALALLAAHLLLALTLIPPWQQPDEPTHVAAVEAQISRMTRRETTDPGREGEILQSMAQYDWWEHRRLGERTPAVLARNFQSQSEAIPGPVGSPAPAGSLPPYAMAGGRIVSWLPRDTVAEDLYWLRGLSAVAGLLTLWVAWHGARECLGALGGAVVALLVALHPQYAIISTAASPDAFVNLAGAFVWWQAVVTVKRLRLLPLALMWVAATAATSVDRMGTPLLAFALLASMVAGVRRVETRTGWSALLVVAGAAGLAAWKFGPLLTSPLLNRVLPADLPPELGAVPWDSFPRLTGMIHQSWWLAPGWGRYTPPAWWMAVASTLTAAALAGATRLLLGRRTDAEARWLLAAAVAGVAIQLVAVHVGIALRLGVGAQGRYLFPFFIPALVILWSGLAAWVPPQRRSQAAAALVLLLALLDLAGWMLVVVPAYADSL